jgi:hypothetical protein
VGRALLGGLLVALLASGCGGGGVDAEEYRGEANALCAAGDQRVEAVGSPTKIDDAEEAAALRRVAAAVEPTVERLEKLETPDDLRDGHADMVESYREGLTGLAELAQALDAGDRAATAEAASKYTTAVSTAQGRARDLDLAGCARFGLPAGS